MGMEPSLEEIFGSYMAYKVTEDTWVISFMNGNKYKSKRYGRKEK